MAGRCLGGCDDFQGVQANKNAGRAECIAEHRLAGKDYRARLAVRIEHYRKAMRQFVVLDSRIERVIGVVSKQDKKLLPH